MFLWFMTWIHAAGSSNKSITALKPLLTFISWNHTSGSRDHHQKLGNTQHTIRENIGSVSKKCWMHIFVQNFFLCLHQRGVLGLCRTTVPPQALQNCSRDCGTQRQEHHTGAGGVDPVVNQHLGEPLASRFSAATGYFPQQCAWAVKCLAALRRELESSTVSI